MCNKIHKDAKRLKDSETSGIGYKLFEEINGKLLTLTEPSIKYRTSEDGSIVWDEHCGKTDEGFCFFFDIDEAKRARRDWLATFRVSKFVDADDDYYYDDDDYYPNIVVRVINFKDGFCEQEENMFITDEVYTIGLCKRFVIA